MRKFLTVFFIGMLTVATAFAATSSSKLNALYEPAGNSIAGNPKGHITVVEFFDYNCGYCRLMYPNLQKLINTDSNIRVLFREYPVLSDKSVLPAKAALAAQKQGKYEALHNAMMEAKMPLNESEIVKLAKSVGINSDQLLKDMKSSEVADQVQTNLALGQQMNIQGVPSFIVVRTTPPSKNQAQVVIGPSIDDLEKLIQQAKDA
jgi:protein-disulfide isomerase